MRPHIKFNGQFGYHLVVIASLLGSNNQEERKEGIDIIIKQGKRRKEDYQEGKNPTATKLTEMVDLLKAVSSPPTIFKYSDKELKQFLKKPYIEELP